MSQRAAVTTTFEPSRTIEPIYTGGAVALSKDGRVLASCLNDEVVLSDLQTGDRLCRVEGDGEAITTLSITPSASHLIVCSRSLSMRIFALNISDIDTTIEAELLRTVKAHTSPVVVSTVDVTSTLVAVGCSDGTIKIWDIRKGFTTHTFHGHSGVISSLHFFEVDQASTQDGPRGRKRSFSERNGNLDEASPQDTLGYRLASGGADGKIRVWDLHKRKSVAILDSHVSVVRSLAYSPSQRVLMSGSRDRTCVLWDARTWKLKKTIAVFEEVEGAGFVKEGPLIFVGGKNGCLRVWDSSYGREITQEQEAGSETDAIVDILSFPDLDFLLSVHADQTLVLHSLHPLQDGIPSDPTAPLPVIRRISGTHEDVIDLAYIGLDSAHLALATNLEEIRIISLATSPSTASHGSDALLNVNYFGADVGALKGHSDIIICLDVDWSGHWLATGAKDNTAKLWRLDPENSSYTCHATFTGHVESLGAIALPHHAPPEGSAAREDPLAHPPPWLVTGSQDKTIKKWDLSAISKETGNASRAAYTRRAHDKDINAIDTCSFTGSGASIMFASASQDRTVKIWDLDEGETIGVLRGHKRGVWTVKFAPKDTPAIAGSSASRGYLATGSGDKTVKVWSVADYSCLMTFEGHTNSVLKVLWLPLSATGADLRDKRGALVASSAADGLVKLWDVASGEAATTLDGHEDRVWALAVKPERDHAVGQANGANGHSEEAGYVDNDAMSVVTDGAPMAALRTGAPLELVSGAADSRLVFWQDTTTLTLQAATAAETELIEQTQTLDNYVHAGDFRSAITLALQLNQPGRLLSLFKNVIEAESQEKGSFLGRKEIDDVLRDLSDEQLLMLLLRLRDWNTNARTSTIAQRILAVVVRSYPTETFARLSKVKLDKAYGGGIGSGKAIRDVLDALKAYTDRHYKRIEELLEESYLLEFTLREMDEVGA